jgi:2-haloacid dehalogenase
LDVGGSLLDLSALKPFFQRLFGDGALVHEWFGQTILYSEPLTLTGGFVAFGKLWGSVLRMLGRIHQVQIDDADIAELAKSLGTLPAHPDVPESLRRLKAAGYRMVTLTDSPATPGAGALHAAGFDNLLECQFTAETVKRYKPARETYAMVAEALWVQLSGLCMIASHPWDLIGARAAGCSAALIKRPGVAMLDVADVQQPQITSSTLSGIADQLVRLMRA